MREHAIFQRERDDLFCEVPIRFSQAALGAELAVPTLGGEGSIKIPAETQTGALFRLRGKGVRNVRSGHVGDLICRVVVETPVKLTCFSSSRPASATMPASTRRARIRGSTASSALWKRLLPEVPRCG